jgi:hypothetical protein
MFLVFLEALQACRLYLRHPKQNEDEKIAWVDNIVCEILLIVPQIVI